MTKVRVTHFEVYGGDPTYLVRVNDDVYEMNDRCSQANGVNMYAGTWDEWRESATEQGRVEAVPCELIKGWLSRSPVYEIWPE